MKVRLLISFAPGYWVILHTSVFLVLFILFITVWVWKNIPVKGRFEIKQETEQDIYAAVDRVPKIKEYLLKEKLIFESGFEKKMF